MARPREKLVTGTFELSKHNKQHVPILKARKALKRAATAPEVQEEARKAGVDAIKCLKEIVNSKMATDVAKISAAQTLLDRGYGRPTQTNVNATVNTDGKPSEVTESELSRRIAETITRVEGLTRRKRETLKSEDPAPDVRKLH